MTRVIAILCLALLSAPAAAQPKQGDAPRQAAKKKKTKKKAAPKSVEPTPEPVVVAAPPLQPVPAAGSADQPTAGLWGLPPLKSDPGTLTLLFIVLVMILIALWLIQRLRILTARSRLLQRFQSFGHASLRLIAVGIALYIAAHLLPDYLAWPVILTAAAALGWSMRHLLADVVAGFVLVLERRLKRGMWIAGDGFSGTVERRGFRATWLRDAQGHQLAVPNRVIIADPMAYDTGADTEHEVTLRLQGNSDAVNVRQCILDAALSSPWVLAGATPTVLRDPADPVVWRIRTRLLEPRFAVQFEGELLERVEDLLRFASEDERPTRPNDTELNEEAAP